MTDRGVAIAMAAAGLFAAACQREPAPRHDPAPTSGSAIAPTGSARSSAIAPAGSAKSSATAPAGSGSAATVVMFECHGINECRGKSACMTPANECSGQNACKGKGWLMLSEADCQAKGGAPKPMAGM